MPRQVDHEGRRREIAEAVCRLADERGLEGVTVRDVAAVAAVSVGAVQRCFRTKEQMLVFALDHIGARITDRIRAHAGGQALSRAAVAISLLDGEHRAEARVWLAFVAQAAVSPALAELLRGNYAQLQAMFARLIGGPDADAEARRLLALADGLTTHVLVGHLTPGEALATLDRHLGQLARDES
jgi:AcrR family transcriptional regulator